MKLKAWDEPLPYSKFYASIIRLDASFSESQCKSLFDKLKGPDGKVNVTDMIFNFTGSEHDTVDYKDKIYKELYQEVYQRGREKVLLKMLEEKDVLNNGKIAPTEMEGVLLNITGGASSKFSSEQIRKFVR